jgi:hypothetical protein
VVLDGLTASHADAVLIDQATVDALKRVPKAQRSGEWIDNMITEIFLHFDPEGGGASAETLEAALRESTDPSENDPRFSTFAHPMAQGAVERYWVREDGMNWFCRFYLISMADQLVAADYCGLAGETRDAEVEEIRDAEVEEIVRTLRPTSA